MGRPPQELFDNGLALICAKDANNHYHYANSRFIETFGSPDGVTDADLFPAAVAGRLRQHDAQVIASGKARLDEEHIPIDDEDRVYLFNRFPIAASDDGPVLGIVAFEVTQRARAEENLLSSRALFEGILDIAADAIVSIDEQQRIALFNQGAERIFGYRACEVLGQPLTLLLPPSMRPMHQRHVEQFERSGGAARQMGERGGILGRRKDGTVFPAEASISRIERDGRATYTAILRDVSVQQEAERSIQALNIDLKQRAAQLESANRELEAFSYSVSHDLRAPLRSIDGFSQVLIEDFFESLPEEARDSLRRIRGASQRMSQLIDDMLTLSRLTRGNVTRRDIDLSAMASAIAGELQADQPDRAVTFQMAESVRAMADPHLLDAVLTNLLANAWKFTSRHETARIEFGSAIDAKGRTVYFVRDDGAGFDMAYADKLFGAFQRLHARDDYSGTGVGLATVQRIVHKHGGEVWAESAVEQGATFYFTLE